VVSWPAFHRLTAISALSRISASFKASVTVLQVAGSIQEEDLLHAQGILETIPRACTDSPRLNPPLLRKELRRKETQPSSTMPQRVGLGYLDDHDVQPVRVSYLHLA
jgi:hypothetical protein